MHVIEAREFRISLSAAVIMHLLLLAALLFSLNWATKSVKPVQAELWSSLPTIATVSPKIAPPKPDPVVKPAPQVQADISLEKKKLEAAKKEAARKEAEQRERERERREAARRELQRQAEESRKKEEQQALARIEARRQEELARLGIDPNAKAGAKGKEVATKAGVQGGAEIGAKTGELADYAAMIRARVLARIRFDPARAPSNPEVIFIVEQLPTGEISAVRKTKASGVPTWDDAVERAIKASDPLPKKKDGTVERVLELRFRPREDR